MSRTGLLHSRDEITRALHALRDGPPLPPRWLAVADQSAAAAAEAMRDFGTAQAALARMTNGPLCDASRAGGGAVADGLALFLAAAGQRKVKHCPHLSAGWSPAPTVLVLSLRWWACTACGLVPPGVTFASDDLCDLCDEHPADNRFFPFASTVASVTVYGEVGSCCVDLMRGAE